MLGGAAFHGGAGVARTHTHTHTHTHTPASQAREMHRNAASPGVGWGTEAVPQPCRSPQGLAEWGDGVIVVLEGVQSRLPALSSPPLQLHACFFRVKCIIFEVEKPTGCG